MSTSTYSIPFDWSINTDYSSNEIEKALTPVMGHCFASSPDDFITQMTENFRWETSQDPAWTLYGDNELQYGNLPPIIPAARAVHRNEGIFCYVPGFVVVIHSDFKFSVGDFRVIH